MEIVEDKAVVFKTRTPHKYSVIPKHKIVKQEGDTYEVAFIDRQGEVMFTGSSADVAAWLDEQGEQVFVGSRAETTAWLDEQRSGEKNYVMPGIVIGIGLLLVLIALVPTRRPTEPARDLVTAHPRGT